MKLVLNNYFSDSKLAKDFFQMLMNGLNLQLFRCKDSWCEDSRIKSTEDFEAAFDDAWNSELFWLKRHAKLEQLRLYVANDIKLSPELEEFYYKWMGEDV